MTSRTALLVRLLSRNAALWPALHDMLSNLCALQVGSSTVLIAVTPTPDTITEESRRAARAIGEMAGGGQLELWSGGFSGVPAALLAERDREWEARWGETNHWDTGLTQITGVVPARTCLRWSMPGVSPDGRPAAALDANGRLILVDGVTLRAAKAAPDPGPEVVTWIDIEDGGESPAAATQRIHRALEGRRSSELVLTTLDELARPLSDAGPFVPGDAPGRIVPPHIGDAAVTLAGGRQGRGIARDRTRNLLEHAAEARPRSDAPMGVIEAGSTFQREAISQGTFSGEYEIEEQRLTARIVGGRFGGLRIDGDVALPARRAEGWMARRGSLLRGPAAHTYLQTVWAHWFGDDEMRGTGEHATVEVDGVTVATVDTEFVVADGVAALLLDQRADVRTAPPGALTLYRIVLAEAADARVMPPVEAITEDGTRRLVRFAEGVVVIPARAIEISSPAGPVRVAAAGGGGEVTAPFAFLGERFGDTVRLSFLPLYAAEAAAASAAPIRARLSWLIGPAETLARTPWPRTLSRLIRPWSVDR